MGNIVNIFLKIGDWVQVKLKTKSGVFVIGLLVGAIPFIATAYVFYQDVGNKTINILQEVKRTEKALTEKNNWQERAFNAESTCLEKIKQMASFFQDLEGMYKKEEVKNRVAIDQEKVKLEKYEEITNQLNLLNKKLGNEN